MLDGAPRIGQSWLERWDSLRLFTPRRFSSLPGRRFARGASPYPTKDETAAYLADYARAFELPVRLDTRVQQLTPEPDGFLATTGGGQVRARQVVIASGPYGRPYLPEAAAQLAPEVTQLHSAQYQRPDDLPPGEVVVVGGGNSAAQLAVELSATHRVTVVAAQDMWFLPARILGISLYWWIYVTGILNGAREATISRRVRALGEGIVGRDLQRLVAAGAVRMLVGRVVGADGRTLRLAGGLTVEADSVLWCTGFRPELSWLDVPGALDETGRPVHDRGASPVAGLHWIGLPWQTRLNSGILDGVDRDARELVRRLAADQPARLPVAGGA